MVRSDTPESGAERSQQRQCWMGMQAAYREYRQAAALVHSLADDLSDDASLDKAISLQTAEHNQRAAFENYVEARFRFLEFSCDQNSHAPGPDGVKRGRFVCAVAAITVGLSAFNLLYVSWAARRQVADLNSIKREANQIINESHQTIPLPSEGFTPNPASPKTPNAGPNRPRAAAKPNRAPSQPTRRPIARLVAASPYPYDQFSVAISPRFTQIGLVRISARSVDRRMQRVSLCVASGSASFCRNGITPNQWLSIRLGDPRRSVDLLVTSISSSRVQGYLRTAAAWPPLRVNSVQSH